MDSISWVDVSIILLYLAGMVVIGIWATRQGAVVSSIISTAVCVALYAVKQFVEIPWLEPIVISLAVSLILMWAVSRTTYKPETSTAKLILSEVTND